MNVVTVAHEGVSIGTVWIARAITGGEWLEGRGADRDEALMDLVDRLIDRITMLQSGSPS